ncbi:hypothetical protein BDZ85DRAFT_270543 [Elsinoe ampelina]|uniref:Uncharacterized protein n=1 Tax=Elsinoe ampelina TaxID=302913 RepID=A0A6A6FXZ9_9PEZI|nr:hypothetical protein BDZ85DRAFT_270543 [Elsinoe ampelina]
MVMFVGCSPTTYDGISKDVKKVQANASDIRDEAMERVGAEKYFKDVEEDWEAYYQAEGGTWTIDRRKGIEGVKKSWSELVDGGLKTAVVVDLA